MGDTETNFPIILQSGLIAMLRFQGELTRDDAEKIARVARALATPTHEQDVNK